MSNTQTKNNNPAPQAKDFNFFAKSACSGAIAAMITHVMMVPVDVIKTQMQVCPKTYPTTATTIKTIIQREGIMGLSHGLGPTNYGYLTQGFFKYGLYEVFKAKYAGLVGPEAADKHSFAIYLAAGATAETIADIFLTPFEAVRIRLVQDPTFARGTVHAMRRVVELEGMKGLYKGFYPLIAKQVPYTAVKLSVFELTESLIYHHVLTKPRSEQSPTAQLCVTAVSGFVGGVASAVASHPADSLLTKVNTSSGGLSAAIEHLKRGGVWAGLVPRMGMVGVLAALQLFAYNAAKVAFGLPTSGGVSAVVGED